MSSSAGRFGYAFRTPYASAKWGVIGLTQSLAKELGPHDIRVNAILPGIIEGPRMEKVIADRATGRHPRRSDRRRRKRDPRPTPGRPRALELPRRSGTRAFGFSRRGRSGDSGGIYSHATRPDSGEYVRGCGRAGRGPATSLPGRLSRSLGVRI